MVFNNKKIFTRLKHKFSFRYFMLGCFVFTVVTLIFFYQKNQDNLLEKQLLEMTATLQYQETIFNQRILKTQVLGRQHDSELSLSLTELELLYKKFKQLDLTAHNPFVKAELNIFNQQLRIKKQIIAQFIANKSTFNKSIVNFLIQFEKLIFNQRLSPSIKHKAFQIHFIILTELINQKLTTPPVKLFNLVNEIKSSHKSETKQFLDVTLKLINDASIFHQSLYELVKQQNFSLADYFSKNIAQHFKTEHQNKQVLKNTLAILIVMGILYILLLLYAVKIKSKKLNQLLKTIHEQQLALDQHAIVSSANVKGDITYVNNKFCEISGYSKNELMGKNHRIVKSGEHTEEEFRQMWRTICRGHVWHGQIKNKKKNGGFYWVNATIVPFLDKKGKPYQYISIRTDITLQKELEKKLLDCQHFLEQVTNTMAQGLYALDMNGHCTFWNKGAENILGWTADELISQKLHSIIHFQDENKRVIVDTDSFIYTHVLKNKNYHSEDECFIHKAGHLLPISITAVPLLEKNNMTGVVVVFNDISKRKADEKIINQAIINAQQASQAKSDFLANMSHEIRTPMNGVIGMTELALETNLTPEQREYLEIVKDSSTALLGIINDILDFSKIEAGKLSLEVIDFNLKVLLTKILAMLMSKAEEKGLHLCLENIDDPKLPTQLRGDPGRLRQVLVNLLGNALKFTHQGSVTMRVELQEKTPQRCCLLFKVTDTGIGVPKNKQATIFDAFSQADTSVARQFGGTGLGLSISKQLIELMGGSIGLESEEGIETTFFFTCWFNYAEQEIMTGSPPQTAPLLTHTNDKQPEVIVSAETHSMSAEKHLPLNILLAEDNLINQKLAKKLLEKQGYTLQIANNGLEAVEMFEQQTFDLILMDFQMPKMNGLDAALKIRELEKEHGGHILIIAMTANAMQEDRDRALNAGMDAYLPKPIDVQQLLAQITQFFPSDAEAVAKKSAAVAEPVCNWDAALKRLGGETEILQMMADLFLEEQTGYFQAIHAAIVAEDKAVLHRELHTLKGICATLGAEKIEALLKSMEPLIENGDFAKISLMQQQVEEKLQQLNVFLRQKIQKD